MARTASSRQVPAAGEPCGGASARRGAVPGQAHLLQREGPPRLQVRRPAEAGGASVGQDHGPLPTLRRSGQAWTRSSSARRPLPGPPNADLRGQPRQGAKWRGQPQPHQTNALTAKIRAATATRGTAGLPGRGRSRGRALGSARASGPTSPGAAPGHLQGHLQARRCSSSPVTPPALGASSQKRRRHWLRDLVLDRMVTWT